MARRTEAYVDTAAFIAFLDRSDTHHALFVRLFSKPPALVTSALVVAEGHGWFLRRYDGHRAIEFLNFVDALSALTVIEFDQAALTRASRVTKKFADQPLTLADAHGLVLMKQRRTSQCWSTDRHLTLQGASLVVSE
jgi:predicted nucleic acid-binding protein